MTEPRRYTKKPVTIEAMQWTGTAESAHAVARWTNADPADQPPGGGPVFMFDSINREEGNSGMTWNEVTAAYLYVAANRARLSIDPGEWIIQDSLGFYPCKPAIFDATYYEENQP